MQSMHLFAGTGGLLGKRMNDRDDLIKQLRDYCDEQDYYDPDNIEYRKFIREAADTLASERAKHAEPVAWRWRSKAQDKAQWALTSAPVHGDYEVQPLYATPPAVQAEPVARQWDGDPACTCGTSATCYKHSGDSQSSTAPPAVQAEPVAIVDLSEPEPRLVQLAYSLTHGQELYAAPPAVQAEPSPCCGEWMTCQRPCLPLANRWRSEALKLMDAPPAVQAEPVDARMDKCAMDTAQQIALMWGQDRTQFVAKIQVAVLEAMKWAIVLAAPPADAALPLFQMQEAAKDLTAKLDEAVRLLERCEQHMYNPFEPDNQSRLYNDLHAYLARVRR